MSLWKKFLNHFLFRRRFAFAVARLCQGAMREVIDARPPLEINFRPDSIAATGFSRNIRWYSVGEHVFCQISIVRRPIVSQEASVRSAINKGTKTALRDLRAFMITP
jgi:hypothetical protein